MFHSHYAHIMHHDEPGENPRFIAALSGVVRTISQHHNLGAGTK